MAKKAHEDLRTEPKAYLEYAIASFDNDPADSDFQRGYLAALRDVLRECDFD